MSRVSLDRLSWVKGIKWVSMGCANGFGFHFVPSRRLLPVQSRRATLGHVVSLARLRQIVCRNCTTPQIQRGSGCIGYAGSKPAI